MRLEVVPDRFDRVEFRSITREPFDMKSRILGPEISHFRALVDSALVPKEDDFTPEMAKKHSYEDRDIRAAESRLLEANVEAHVFAEGRHGDGGESGNLIVSKAVADDGCLSLRTPRASFRRNEEKAAFVNKDQMGSKLLHFFLCAATLPASIVRWRLRSFESPFVPAPGNSNPSFVGSSTSGLDDSRR